MRKGVSWPGGPELLPFLFHYGAKLELNCDPDSECHKSQDTGRYVVFVSTCFWYMNW